MNNILIIMEKELLRIFKDKRLCFTTIIMPGLMLYVMYTLVGNVMDKIYNNDADNGYIIVAEGIPSDVENLLENNSFYVKGSKYDEKYYINKVKENKLDTYIVFEKNFEEKIVNKQKGISTDVPNIYIYYNSQNNTSYNAYITLCSLMNAYKDSIYGIFYVNSGNEIYDVATTKDSTGQIVSMIFPVLLMTILFSICTSVAPDSIAGEKERGTMATLLVTPIKRSELAIGKIAGLSIIVILGGISSFMGAMLALPALSMGQEGIDTSVYSFDDYCGLFVIVISTVLLMISCVSIISVMAKSIKEAATSMAPFTILIAVIGISGMYKPDGIDNAAIFLIPLYNCVQCMNEIFSFRFDLQHGIITILFNCIYTITLIVILSKMFKNEKIIL